MPLHRRDATIDDYDSNYNSNSDYDYYDSFGINKTKNSQMQPGSPVMKIESSAMHMGLL